MACFLSLALGLRRSPTPAPRRVREAAPVCMEDLADALRPEALAAIGAVRTPDRILVPVGGGLKLEEIDELDYSMEPTESMPREAGQDTDLIDQAPTQLYARPEEFGLIDEGLLRS